MSAINKVILIGRLGQNPEVRHLESGQTVSNFSLATSETYSDKSGKKIENTEWHSVVLWSKLAEISEKYLNKGDLVYIEGRLKTRSWESEGNKLYKTEIIGNVLKMLGSKSDKKNHQDELPGVPADDLPF